MCMCVSQIGQWFKWLQYFITWMLKRDTCRASSPLMSGARPFSPNPDALPCLCSRVLLRCLESSVKSVRLSLRNSLYFTKLLCLTGENSPLFTQGGNAPEQWRRSFHQLLGCGSRWSINWRPPNLKLQFWFQMISLKTVGFAFLTPDPSEDSKWVAAGRRALEFDFRMAVIASTLAPSF